MSKQKETINAPKSLFNIKSKYCLSPELSDQFVSDVLNITGYEIDEEGFVVDPEDDPIFPEYVQCKGRLLRLANSGILHVTDLAFDPYYNITIMEELFQQYLANFHPEIVSTHIHAHDMNKAPKTDTYGYITIIYGDGSKIQTDMHYKDTTKYLDAFMRLESMNEKMIKERLKPYDDYEKEFYKKYKTLNPAAIMEGKK